MGRRTGETDGSDHPRLEFGEPTPGRAIREALFFALLPEREAALRLIEAGRALFERYGLAGPLRPAARLHVSLLGFRVDRRSLGAWTGAGRRIGGTIRRAPIAVVFEGAMSFGGAGRRALVMACSQGSEAALTGLHDRLRDATDDLGVTRLGVRERFMPHLTVAYDASPIPETALDAPIRWMASELVLVRSEQGRGRHTCMGRWPLKAT